MALAPCAECGAQISSKAASCPQCGAKPSKPRTWPWYLGGAAAILGLILYSGHRIGEEKLARNKQECSSLLLAAIRKSDYTPGEAEAIVRADPRAREVCADFEINGVPVIP